MTDEGDSGARQTDRVMLDIIRRMRENPEEYKAVNEALRNMETDEERVGYLVRFATTERELAALIPASSPVTEGGDTGPTITTVTVTTVMVEC